MRIRLFWKILFSFWLTFICIVEGVWIIFSINDAPQRRPWQIAIERDAADTGLSSAVSGIELGGRDGMHTIVRSWPDKERARFSYAEVTDGVETPASIEQQNGPIYARFATLPDGTVLRLAYDASDVLPHFKPGPFSFPIELPILALVGGLLFSSLLAWYLIVPVWRLRMGFDKLTHGELSARLKHLMGGRRDEIADLARDFDLMAERMESLVKSREQLLHDVSHELRSPLARQHMAIGLARQTPYRTPMLLDRIEQESSRMDDLVGELLTLSRAESGAVSLEEYFDLRELVRVVVNSAAFEAEQEGVSVAVTVPPDQEKKDTTIKGDAELVRRALENVIRNGVRHTPSGTSVDVLVGVDESRGQCLIDIVDHGPGIPPGALDLIFEPFVKLADGKQHGVGLGLSIAQRAIKAHGGTITAENHPNAGLAITIALNLATAEVDEVGDFSE